MSRHNALHLIGPAVLVVMTACQETPTSTAPIAARVAPSSYAPQQVQRWFDVMAREGLALPGTVLADYDETTNRVVVGSSTLPPAPTCAPSPRVSVCRRKCS